MMSMCSAPMRPGVQARRGIHPPLPPGPRRPIRVETEYARGGTLAYLAVYDVHRARDGPVWAHDRHRAVHPAGGPGMGAEPSASARG
jgi:hypothetical protein